MELLSIEDFKDFEFDPNQGPFDYLLEVARVGRLKLMKGNFKNKAGDEKKKAQGLVFNYFQNNALKVEGLVEEEAKGFKNEKSLNKNSGLKRKLKGNEQEEVGLKLKRRKMNAPVCPNPPPELPENVKQHIVGKMGGSDLRLVIQKPIFFSDVNPGASRFSIPILQIQSHEFLSRKEEEVLMNNKRGMEVSLLDPSLRETTLNFKRWKMNGNSMYVLTTMWNWVAKNNQLEKNDVVQLWSFRVESRLCFALVKVDTVQQGSEEGFSNENGASSSHQEEEYGGLYCEDGSAAKKQY